MTIKQIGRNTYLVLSTNYSDEVNFNAGLEIVYNGIKLCFAKEYSIIIIENERRIEANIFSRPFEVDLIAKSLPEGTKIIFYRKQKIENE